MKKPTNREQEIIDAYMGDDETEPLSAQEISDNFKITTQRVYQVLAKHKVPLKTGPTSMSASAPEFIAGTEMVQQAFREIAELKYLLGRYQEKYGELPDVKSA